MKLALLAVAGLVAGGLAALGVVFIWAGGAIDEAIRKI